ncbi:TonB-dependent receptor [Brumicola nitratireducens]|uniref:OmpA family Oar-like outer membrane protein n=1 Tax=Glaciecola nitratireducens (strain JCM 12485 / KCTC 12276 / FR1064) TaxID=1085623 RepID=G4QIF6_GLANF|nr:TonB-dependent receptor [Glaciecola nitratireducens]AEP30870.1 OmpA family Oar-like outer membrane protein [Glaciecola nitratireducens FR1064]
MLKKNKLNRVAIAVALTVGLSTSVLAQTTTSAIRGNVSSEAGSIVSGATVTITHVPSGTVSTATTNESGVFSARGLRVGGPYSVTITGSDFTSVQIDDLFVSLDQTLSLPIEVQGNANREVIVVTGTRAQGGFSNDGLSTSLGLEALNEVASIDRDITDAAELDPFASVNFQSGGAKELTIAGANNRFNSLTIDGVALNDRFGLNANGYPTQRSPISFDAIESLSIQTAPFDVEYNGFTGGTINAVTKSGTNEFHGSLGYYHTSDSLIGDKNGDDDFDFAFEEDTFVGTLGGAIIKDKLFFFVAYDKYEEVAPLNNGPVGSGAVNIREDITLDDVAQVGQIVSDVWGFDIGDFNKGPAKDEKILANIDWNITDDHRAKFTYLLTDGNTIQEQNGNNFLASDNILGASSAWYDNSERVESFIGHVFSDWTANFSTQVKIASTTQATGQDSLSGNEFPNFAVFLREVDGDENYLTIGPDRFRHGNELDQDFMQYKFVAEYSVGDHILKAGYEREEVEVNNLFAQNSEGSYVFDSIEDLRNATASGLLYDNAVTNNENDLRAIWGYNSNSLYIQDSWDVNGYLTIDAGLRYDWYESEGQIRENQNFIDRYGYSNANDIDGLDVILPRVSFKWLATEDLTVRGGLGRFSGGAPGVWISNSYSNDGVISDSSNAFGTINVPTTPDPATGQYIPQDVLNTLATEAPDGSVNALRPDFEIPTTWKLSLGAAYAVDIPYLGEDWLLSGDFLYNKLENASYWYDQRCENPVDTAPDGRGVYDCSNGPEAIAVGSVDDGDGMLLAFSASNDWDTDYGRFDMFTSYTYADVEDVGYGTSSTATSNYSDFAAYDRQKPRAGTSNYQTEHLAKVRFNWSKEIVNGYQTKVSIFATRRSGQPYSYTFNENNACVLDVGGGRCARESRNDDAGHLLYVPTGVNDPLFAASSFGGDAAAQQEFFNYINSSELGQYAGGIAPRNGDNSRWSTIIDLRIQQELPAINEDHKFLLFFDIENFGNLLNSDWGRVERTRYEYERSVVSASIVDGQYEYFSLRNPDSIKNLEVLSQSVWQIQFGLKYEF